MIIIDVDLVGFDFIDFDVNQVGILYDWFWLLW